MTEKRILAIDYGSKRIGIAVTDPLMMFGYPLTTISNDSKMWDNLLNLFKEYKISKIVLGYPLKENNEKSASTLMVEKFCEELKQKIDIPIELIDERYSSEIASERILAGVKSRKKRRNKGLVDMNAACVILQDYLGQNS
ncbi:MAG: Holliday junction resolvase RuvX [Ignavibacteriae bacterium]|nr:Holliday junction resolvase RuvX [Ignavibacteriota bacterium]NOG97375.1 Holliday junction resolvase RuvX [Ignavibacteriota bacterium]